MTDRLTGEDEFPLLRELTYLNTASVGLVPESVQADAARFDRDVCSRGTTWFDEVEELRVLDRARAAAAAMFNATEDEIAVVSSATELLCQLAWHVRPVAGENVVSIDSEFPSVVYPWWRIAQDTGAEIRLLPVRDAPATLTVDRLAGLVDSNTRAICVSLVQYWNGAQLDLGALSKLAHEADAVLIVDATQAAGAVPIDVSATPVDALVTGGYKFLCGPFGAAVGYLSPSLLEDFTPPFVGWRTADNAYSFDATKLRIAPSARRLEFSTMNYTAALSLGAALEHINGIGVNTIAAHNRELVQQLFNGLVALNAEVISPIDAERRGSIVTARFPGRDGEQVAAQLNTSGVIVSPRVGTTRFAPHFFNNSDDVSRALSILGEILSSTTTTSSAGQFGMTEPRAPAPAPAPAAGPAELPQALVLNEPEIRSLVTPALALEAVRQAFITYARGDALLPDVLHMDLPGHRGEIHVKGGFLAGASTWCVKAASAFYDNPGRGLPIATGVSLALSAETGFLQAILLDNGYLTELRTGAAGALAADLLAPEIVHRVLIIGAGGQARYQLEALLEVRRPQRVFVHSRTRAHAEQYAAEMTAAHGIPVEVAESLPEAASASQLIVMTTPARSPILRAEWLGPGTHITAMGSDLPGKQELFVDVLERADVYVADNVTQAATQGELQHGLAAKVINLEDVLSLGNIAAGIQPGRTSPTQTTVADLTGVGVQDTAIADLAVTLAEATGAGRLLGAP